MCAIPARVAGVKKIVMTTPPANAIPEVLYAASVAGVDEVYRLGGAHAIAAFAYGTRSIPGVNIIAGPGSRYVTEAKRQVFGDVGIDLIAGPSEIAVICDDSADTAAVCADLLAQAEHSPDTRSYVFSDSESFLKALKKRLAIELRTAAARAPHLRTVQITFRRCTYDEAVHEVNRLAPEHLEIIHRKADAIAARVKNAGAIFIGSYSPVALGDYYAGPSHVLPTAGTARFSSGLSVRSFLKRTSVIKADARVLANAAPDIIRLAESEKLFMHAESIRRRIKRTGL
jgi:histidinol dehydrogenase